MDLALIVDGPDTVRVRRQPRCSPSQRRPGPGDWIETHYGTVVHGPYGTVGSFASDVVMAE